MHLLIYSSSATHPFSDDELQELLTKARLRNARENVTGLLLYHDGQFMQLLEGDADVVHRLYSYIEQDPRHTSVLKLADKHVEARSFPDWAMAFRPVQAADFERLEGFRSPSSLDPAFEGLSGADSLLLNLLRQYMLVGE
ncbi:BLUF domain-containing protein [Hymenobacter tibetensis]|uniref:BLUF domain-containing protein n=1 Tax=Hymenobacter tibetensis TaxID=497967 RepID=A0ABY4D6A2_9BACT|nr:BLUF domain-containing protein [Hymenobacter tibetensis]UOG77145.1 BLUF domain-containing protein [Hymenobacter tibetensis]